MDPQMLEQLLRSQLGGSNPTNFNPEMLRAQQQMPNPNFGGIGGRLRQAAVGLQNGLGRFSNTMFPMDPNVAKHMTAEQMKSIQGQGMMNFGLGMLGAASQPGARFGGALADGYFGAQKGMLGQQQQAYQLGAREREEGREIEATEEDKRRYGIGQGMKERDFAAGRDDETWMRDYRNRALTLEGQLGRGRLSALEQANNLSPEAIDLVAQATLRRPELMNNYLSRSGMGNQANRNLVTERQAQILKDNGTSADRVASIQASVKAQSGNIAAQTKSLQNLKAFEAVAKANGDRILQLIQKIPDRGVPLLNGLERAARQGLLGDADVAEFNQVLQNFQAETARIVAGHPQLLGNTTDTARQEIADVVSGKFTAEQTERIIKRLLFEAQVRREGFEETLRESSRSIEGLGMPGQSFPGGAFETAPMPSGQPMTVQPPGADRVVNFGDL